MQWTDEATGLVCLAKRNPHLGFWCGYVGVPPSHPWHGKDYNDLEDVIVHGGVTFTGDCGEGPPAQTICHVPEEGTPEDLWWIGFDCAHLFDFCPFYARMERDVGDPFVHDVKDIYRTLDYVRSECAQLAAQVALK